MRLLQAFAQLQEDFPVSCRAVLDNLQRGAQQRAEQELAQAGLAHLLADDLLGRWAGAAAAA